MKLNKQIEKNCVVKIKEFAAKSGYKKNQNTIYKIENENIIIVDFFIVNSEKLIYRINIKKQSYDEIFWNIMGMQENISGGLALRVNGAFSAPGILISKGTIELLEDIDIFAADFMKIIDKEIEYFHKRKIEEYIFSEETQVDEGIIKCLYYIDNNSLTNAKLEAERKINNGDKGRFENGGKGFFELVLINTIQ